MAPSLSVPCSRIFLLGLSWCLLRNWKVSERQILIPSFISLKTPVIPHTELVRQLEGYAMSWLVQQKPPTHWSLKEKPVFTGSANRIGVAVQLWDCCMEVRGGGWLAPSVSQLSDRFSGDVRLDLWAASSSDYLLNRGTSILPSSFFQPVGIKLSSILKVSLDSLTSYLPLHCGCFLKIEI